MKTDWVAEVFSAARDCGECISIVYGQKSGALDAEARWFELPHDEHDGIGGFASLLRREGFTVAQLPTLRDDRFTFWRALRGFFTALPSMKLRQRQWRQFNPTRPVSFLPVQERLAWQLLTEEQTRRVVAAAKAVGVTVNTYLLFHLDAAISAKLTPPASSRRWMIPVNLRGALTRHTESALHMSFLAVDIGDDASLSRLQAQINRLRQQAYHWGAWVLLNAGKLIGAKAMRRDMRNREKKHHGWTGIFSNLGIWEISGSDSWIFCPAISRVHPVGAGCVTMNGRMAMTMQLHEALGADLRTSYSLLEAWRRAALQETSRAEAAASQPALTTA